MEQKNLLYELGLSPKEAQIYQLMLTLGKVRAKDVKKQLDMPRATVYEILANLVEKGLLLEELDKSNITVYQAKHPYALKDYIESKKQKLDQTEAKLDSIFNDFVSLYSQNQTRPGVKFYEGNEGVWKVLKDTLSSKTEILMFVDSAAIIKFSKEINDKYVKMRTQKGVKKKIILANVDKPLNPNTEFTEYKIFKQKNVPFNTSIQIYDNKVAYITFTDEYTTSTIVEDANIYQMHKIIFEYMWQNND